MFQWCTKIIRNNLILSEFSYHQGTPKDEILSFFQSRVAPDLDIQTAHPQRRLDYYAGRFCASQAMAFLERKLYREVLISRGNGGAPHWPEGHTGSITHTAGRVCALVGKSNCYAAIGVDCERFRGVARSNGVLRRVFFPEQDQAVCSEAGFFAEQALILVFSAKESLYKALYPSVNKFFGFQTVALARIDRDSGSFLLELKETLSPRWRLGTLIPGRFEIGAKGLLTYVYIHENKQ